MSNRTSAEKGLMNNRNFMLLFMGRMVSRVGDALYSLGITWFILDLTGAGTTMSLYLATGMITYLLMGPLAGVLVDRWNRVRVLYGTDLIRGVLIGLGGCLYFLGADAQALLGALFMITIGTNVCSALFNPAATALTPRIVPTDLLTRANSLQSMVDSGASIAGMVLGGIIYTVIGIQGIFVINAVSFILSGFSEFFIRAPAETPEVLEDNIETASRLISIWNEFRQGYIYIRSQRWLVVITVFAFMINLFIYPFMTIYIPYTVNQIMKIQPVYLSYIQAAIGTGILLGSLTMSRQTPRETIGAGLRLSFSVLLVPLIVMATGLHLFTSQQMALLVTVVVFIGSSFVMGFMMAFVNIPINVAMQKRVPNMILGRVDAVFSTLLMTGIPIGTIAGGILTDILPMTWILAGTVTALVMIAAGSWLHKGFADF